MHGRNAPAVARLLALPDAERVVGVYHLVKPLGRGGFAPVWLAREVYGDSELRTVAIKLFALDEGHTRPGMGTTGTMAARHKRDAIVAEARALCQVEHPNVVRFFAIATDASGDVLGLAMEHVQGTPLDARLDEKTKLSFAETIDVGRAVASALAAVHAVGLVHRDVKPANVIDAAGVYKLIDFGVAASREAKKDAAVVMDDLLIESAPLSSSGSEAGASTGTLGYIDPACMSGATAATPASDLYSLGAMLFECAAGAVPSLVAARLAKAPGMDADVLEGRARAPALADVEPDAPPGLARIVDLLLDPDPSKRPRSAEAVAWELERLRREVAGRARPIPPEEKGPFRGLGRFEESDRDVYFGRGMETAGGLEMVRAHGLVALIGPSGSGKSSLARAGIVPSIVDGELGGWPRKWDEVALVPGTDPRAALRAALRPFVPDADDRSPDELVAALADRTQREGRGTVVLVDQLEELVTTDAMGASGAGGPLAADDPRAFAAAFLARAGAQIIPGVRCIVTARRDMLDELLAIGDLGRVMTRGSLFVAPLTDAAWEGVVDSALAAYGYRLEDDDMRRSLLEQLEGTASAMPLVQFALTELWSRRDRENKTIPRAALDDIGGIAGALEMHADATLRSIDAMAPDAHAAARAVLVALTTAKGSRATRTLDELAAWAPGASTARVIDALEEARLIVREAEGLTLAHEALLSRWGALRAWVEEARADRLAAEEIARDAMAWDEEKRPADRLLAGRRLRAARELASRAPHAIDDVARAFLEAGRARQRRSRALASVPVVVTLALAVALVARWDAQRVKLSHCGGYVRRWQVMECVAPLEDAQRAARPFSYLFHTQRGRVLKVERVARTGELVADDERDVVFEYRWDGDRLRESTVRDRRGQVTLRNIFSDDRKRAERRDEFSYPSPLPGTNVAVTLYDYDARGFVSRTRFQTIRGATTPDEKQAYGYAWTANGAGFYATQEVLGADGERALGKDGVARVSRDYDAFGNIVLEHLLGPDGKPVLGELGYATRKLQYDAAGNMLDERYFDVDGAPIAARLGYDAMRSNARRAFVRDASGDPIEVAFYDAKGELTPRETWACGWTSKFDVHGREIERAYFGAKHEPITTSEGYAIRRMTYDARGNEIERKYLAADGKPTTHNYGNASWRKTYDDAGFETEYVLVGLDAQPVVVADGYSSVVYKWDADHHLIEEAYFGLGDRKRVQPRHLNYSRKTNVWLRGRLVESAYFGADDAPVLDGGSASERYQLDAWGNVVETSYFGVNGRPTLYPFFSTRQQKFDEKGNLAEVSFLIGTGNDRKLARGFGYSRASYTYDDFGRRTGEAYFDADGRRTTDLSGEGGWLQEYDAHGRVTSHTFVDARGQPALSRDGMMRWTAKYDAHGREIERAYFGRDGAPTMTRDGHARQAVRYDAVGDAVEATYFDAAGGVVRAEQIRYDDRHRMIERTILDGEGKPQLGKQGYARETVTYDARGFEVEGAYFDEKGSPVVAGANTVTSFASPSVAGRRKGVGAFDNPRVARWTRRLDARGLEVERASFGANGAPMLADGAARVESIYDALGHKLEERAFGVDDKPIVRLAEGTAGWRAAYDEVGRQIRMEHLGVDGGLTLDSDGVAGWTSTYDGAGNETARAFFGKDGAPIADKRGAARWTATYDERRLVEERRWFGVDGKPAVVQGCARSTRAYDDRGKLVEAACFDAHDQPTNDESGVAREVHRYDAQGNDAEESFYDKDALLVAKGGGYARKTSRYDMRGNAVDVVYYGGDGRPMLFKSLDEEAWRVTRKYDDRNELLESVLHGVDGKRRADSTGVAIRRFVRDDRGVVTEEAFFDADAKPVVAKDLGFARRVITYDDRGLATEAAYFGAKGERVAPKGGAFARVVHAYDARARETETRWLGVDDRPVAGPDGCAIVRRAYDARDLGVEQSCFAADDKPALDGRGVARWRATFGAGNRETERRYFGVDDKPVVGKAGWARRTIAYDGAGVETTREHFDAKGAPVVVKTKD